MNVIMSLLNEISEQLQKGNSKAVNMLVEQAVAEGLSPLQILNDGLLVGMGVIGTKFKNNEVFVPQVLMSARAMNTGVTVIKPLLVEAGVKASGKVCLGTVKGDLHDIGKNLVKTMMESKGIEVVDLGVDVPPSKFVETAVEQGCQVIACSALLTTTMGMMKETVETMKSSGIRDSIKIMVGGAPVSQAFCDQIGADCYAADATSAAEAAVMLCC